MKTITNFATWSFADDVTAGTSVIETKEPTGGKKQNINGTIADITEAVLILSAVLAIWIPIVALLLVK